MAVRFEIPGALRGIEALGSGHIHRTYVALFEEAGATRRFVLQRLNGTVFRDLDALMGNLERICAHLRSEWRARRAMDVERRCLRIVRTREGRSAAIDDEGGWWRAFPFQEGTRSVDVIESPQQAFEAARAFGEFAQLLDRLPGPPLAETIAHFHDAKRRLADFERAVADDVMNRGAGVAAEIEAARRAWEALDRARRSRRLGALPRRTVHNDCKINNLLLDADTGEGLCVVDLDTVMEGDVACDFGELLRTGACTAREDERDLDRIRVDPDLLGALSRGYVQGAGPLLRDVERRALPLAGPALALENALRFLGDHLAGDRYFRIQREGHNLDRARAQLRRATRLLEACDLVEAAVDGNDAKPTLAG